MCGIQKTERNIQIALGSNDGGVLDVRPPIALTIDRKQLIECR